ncbi:VOC family protein [Shewanella sp. Scap07]|uniref:VOC family protein n=1 Tax=Shewanella sp. Scap07 TaxID=2589987 RepID=UPI0015BDAA71|nr:VOC family protein [Shewanella sp. Scap07]QLE85155.1 VOC family protein [Shewanella sp. Scap07]
MQPATITVESLQQGWTTFERKILTLLSELHLDPLNLHCDHVALRVNSTQAADELVTWFSRHGEIISNNIINGRPILIIALDTPLQIGGMTIDCVELPYPGDKHYPQEGWEHIELVLPCDAQDCEQLSDRLIALVPALAPVLNGDRRFNIKMSSPKGEAERLANPTIAIKADDVCIKIHPHTIRDIIASEQR